MFIVWLNYALFSASIVLFVLLIQSRAMRYISDSSSHSL